MIQDSEAMHGRRRPTRQLPAPSFYDAVASHENRFLLELSDVLMQLVVSLFQKSQRQRAVHGALSKGEVGRTKGCPGWAWEPGAGR